MPKFSKLSKSEIEKLKARRSAKVDLSNYLSFLSSLRSGDWGVLTLDEGESQRAIKRRLTTASKQQGKEIRYRRSEQGQVIFEVR